MPSRYSQIEIESAIHGAHWQRFHGGYFSDPAAAAPYIGLILNAINISNPGVIVDLGGGTGFVLKELIKHSTDPRILFVNLDLSGKQLEAAESDRILRVRRSMTEFRRADVCDETARFLFVMRSALHYCGRRGMIPFLRHLRAQMTKGEFFVHQTACFDNAADASCVNKLYEHMGTSKWYPQTKYLLSCLEKEGWSVTSVAFAPKLPLTSQDLAKRYRLSKDRLSEIRDDLLRRFGEKENIFESTPKGFRAFLPYQIFTCAAR